MEVEVLDGLILERITAEGLRLRISPCLRNVRSLIRKQDADHGAVNEPLFLPLIPLVPLIAPAPESQPEAAGLALLCTGDTARRDGRQILWFSRDAAACLTIPCLYTLAPVLYAMCLNLIRIGLSRKNRIFE